MSLFSDRIRYAREMRNLSQKEVAEMVKMSQQGYSNIETGRREPNLATLRYLRHTLDESLDFFIGYNVEDRRAELLYELYAEARRIRIEKEEDLEYSSTLLNEPTEDVEKRVKLMRHYKDQIKEYKLKEDRAFDLFYEHVSNIPGYEEYGIDREYWIKSYDEYQENNKKINHSFWEEFESI